MDGLWWKIPIKTNDFATPIKRFKILSKWFMDGLWWKIPIKTNDFATPIKI